VEVRQRAAIDNLCRNHRRDNGTWPPSQVDIHHVDTQNVVCEGRGRWQSTVHGGDNVAWNDFETAANKVRQRSKRLEGVGRFIGAWEPMIRGNVNVVEWRRIAITMTT